MTAHQATSFTTSTIASARASHTSQAPRGRRAAAGGGARVAEPGGEAAARARLAEMAAGVLPSEPLRRRLSASLSRPAIQPARSHPSSAAEWRGASADRHAETLRDLLELT